MKKVLKAILLITLVFTLFGCKSSDYKNALNEIKEGNYQVAIDALKGIEDYENYKDSKAYIEIAEAMLPLQENVGKGNELLNNSKKLLNEELIDALTNALTNGEQIINTLKENLNTASESYNPSTYLADNDYESTFNTLKNTITEFDESQQKYALVDNPSDTYVIECLKTIDEIVAIDKATEDNDPNGNLNKDGGYTAQVYFESSNVDQEKALGDDIIDKGTDAGGSIEVYSTEEYAINRNKYLSAFDGSLFSSGSHKVIGTVVVRTSDLLSASKQDALEAKIIESLTKLDK